jgi:hypothetical protein
MNNEASTHSDNTPFDNFTDLARRLFAVPKHELDEEIAKEKAEQQKRAQEDKPKKRHKEVT